MEKVNKDTVTEINVTHLGIVYDLLFDAQNDIDEVLNLDDEISIKRLDFIISRNKVRRDILKDYISSFRNDYLLKFGETIKNVEAAICEIKGKDVVSTEGFRDMNEEPNLDSDLEFLSSDLEVYKGTFSQFLGAKGFVVKADKALKENDIIGWKYAEK